MMKCFTFFFVALLLLKVAEGRSISSSTLFDSDIPVSSAHVTASPEQPSIDDEGDDGCKGLESEECLIRRSMVAHIDYIYTQDIKGP
ncbi:phytosulfokines 3-like [Quillaja saponaria]|uniref:Phytosulfokine n=1 Tax=Quillaja saponaria TaxID=32244 RepID=A0AAD7L9B7_QUISA|nr:phytosulfokines 3-like [Quillaja saponaria]